MMSEKRFTIHKENMYKEDWYDNPFCIKEDGEVVLETIPLYIAEKVRDKLNELNDENKYLKKRIKAISDELYCKDRKLEELGIPIECCDKDE